MHVDVHKADHRIRLKCILRHKRLVGGAGHDLDVFAVAEQDPQVLVNQPVRQVDADFRLVGRLFRRRRVVNL